MSAIESLGPKFGKVNIDDDGKVQQFAKTMDGSFDPIEVVDALVKAREIPIKKLEDQNEINEKLLTELSATENDFSPVLDRFKNLSNPSSLEGGINLFGVLSPSLSSGSGLTNSSELASFEVTNHKIDHQVFSFEVTQKASYDKMISNDLLTSTDLTTTPISSNGNLQLAFKGKDKMTGSVTVLTANLGTPIISSNGNLTLKDKDGVNVDIALDTTMTLEKVKDTINQNSYKTGITAELENDSNTGMRLVLKSQNSGHVIDPTASTASILTDLGLESNPVNLTQTAIDIPLTTAMDYNEIVTTINSYTDKTDVHAEIVKIGTDQYKFTLVAQTTGRVIDPSGSDNSVKTGLGINGISATTQDNLLAKVKYKGIEIKSETNSFELYSGLKVNVLKAETNNLFNVTIGPPIDALVNEIETMIENVHSALENLRERLDETNKESHMQKINEFKRLENQIANIFAGSNLAQYGLMRDDSKLKAVEGLSISEVPPFKLVFDEAKFRQKAAEDFDAVKSAFAFNDHKVGTGEINLFSKPKTMPTDLVGKIFNVKVTAVDADNKPTAADFEILNGATIAATVENGVIKGTAGTDFEGFSFYYYAEVGATLPLSVQFSPTYGTMNSLVNLLDSVFTGDSSFVSTKEKTLVDETTKNFETIDRKKIELEDYRLTLIRKYQTSQSTILALESAIAFLKVGLGIQMANK